VGAVTEAAGRIVGELGLPASVQTARAIEHQEMEMDRDGDGDGGGAEKETNEDADIEDPDSLTFFVDGILLQLSKAGSSGSGDGIEDAGEDAAEGPGGSRAASSAAASAVQRKATGHEIRGQRLVHEAAVQMHREWVRSKGPPLPGQERRRLPPVCTPLAAVVDALGYRVYAFAVPPLESAETLVYGKESGDAPFLDRSPLLHRMLRQVGRRLNIAPHQLETVSYAAARTAGREHEDPETLEPRIISVPLSAVTVGHQGYDRRFYVTNLARLMPADMPAPGTDEIDSQSLRPELVRRLQYRVSSDAFRAHHERHA